jgi:Carboxypeptidase regulatory-like domain/TonB-dependent Receptor Plug Domain
MNLNRFRLGILCLALCTLALVASPTISLAQSTTQGSISGSVLDSSGAAIPGAVVTIRNTATDFTVKLVADASGYFKAPLLEPGTYTVAIAAPNFAGYRADNVIVVVGQATSLEPRMAVASSSAEVIVTEQTPVMNLESPDFSDTLNQQAMQNIPINNRRWSALAMTTPGVVSDGNGYGLVSIRGVSPILNNVEIDGADDNQAFFAEERGRTREAYSTAGNAVREFAVNTGVYSAEYGRAAGGVITSVTKSGTNQLHGQAYFYDRESNWNAYNDWTTIAVPGSSTQEHIKPEDLRKIYGFTAGGALIKDKLFWIYTYDQHTHVFPVVGIPYNPTNFYTMPSASLPAGAVCYLNGSATPPTVAYQNGYLAGDTKVEDQEACTLAARQGFTSYAPAAADWASLINGGNLDNGNTDLGLNSDLGQVSRFGYQEINTPKLDWQINPKEHWSVLYHRLRWDSPGGVQTTAADNYARDTDGNDFVKLDYGLTKLTSLLTNNISNELLFQYGRELDDEGQQPYTPYTLADMNPTKSSTPGNIPEVLVASSSSGWGFSAGSPYYSYRTAYPLEKKWQIGDILYWNKGNQSFKFGVDMVHNYDFQNNLYEGNGEYSYPYLGLYMNDLLNFKKGVNSTAAGCDSSYAEYATQYGDGSSTKNAAPVTGVYPCYADFYQGFGTPTFALNTLDTGIFAQDNWKFSPRLTLELGLRYDHEALPTPSSLFTTAAGAFTPYNGVTNAPDQKFNMGPRVGFAYDVYGSGNTVLRGGWGMYFGRITNGNLLEVLFDSGSPNAQTSPTFYNAPTSTISEGPQYPAIFATGNSTAKPNSYFFSPNLKLPEVQEFDLQLQQAVGRGTFMSLSYLGSLGRELPNFLDVNLNPASLTVKTVTINDASGKGPLGATGSTYTPSVYTAYGNTALLGANAANFGSITEMVSNVNSAYNAFVVEVLNRSLKSLQFDANYTWSHALDFSQNALTEGTANSWYDPYSNAGANYGNSAYNVPNRFVAYALYSVPGIHSANMLKWVTNGWSIDDSFQMQNGLPYTAGFTGKISGAIGSNWNGAGGTNGIIPGYIGVNTFQYPRHIVDDARVDKAFDFENSRSLDLVLNVFNVANHQNITGVGTTAYSISGSTLTYLGQGASNPSDNTLFQPTNSNSSGFLYTPREVEIAAKFSF